MNPNHQNSHDPNRHIFDVWNTLIADSGFTKLLIIANSSGGDGLTNIQKRCKDTFYQRVE